MMASDYAKSCFNYTNKLVVFDVPKLILTFIKWTDVVCISDSVPLFQTERLETESETDASSIQIIFKKC